MPKFDESVINFAVYEDSVEYAGMAKVSLPDLTALTQSVSGAGIAGNIDAVILGHFEAMTLVLNFRTTTEQAVRLSEPRRHTIDIRVAQQIEDTVAGTLRVQPVSTFSCDTKKDAAVYLLLHLQLTGLENMQSYWATYIDGGKKRGLITQTSFVC